MVVKILIMQDIHDEWLKKEFTREVYQLQVGCKLIFSYIWFVNDRMLSAVASFPFTNY